jgi:hypothetical protein
VLHRIDDSDQDHVWVENVWLQAKKPTRFNVDYWRAESALDRRQTLRSKCSVE